MADAWPTALRREVRTAPEPMGRLFHGFPAQDSRLAQSARADPRSPARHLDEWAGSRRGAAAPARGRHLSGEIDRTRRARSRRKPAALEGLFFGAVSLSRR